MTDAVWYECGTATQSALQALGLSYNDGATALPLTQIVLRKLAIDRHETPPLLMACLGGVEEYDPGDFEDIIVHYPVLILHVFASNQDYRVNHDLLRWRQAVIDMAVEFENTLRPLIATAYLSEVAIDPAPSISPNLFKDNLDVGGILLKFRTGRARTR